MKEEALILFPYADIKHGSKIIIYGAGDIGQALYWQIKHNNYCEIVGWMDRIWADDSNAVPPKMWMNELKNVQYDVIIIAVSNKEVAEQIADSLVINGADRAKLYHSDNYVVNYPLVNLKRNYINKSQSDIYDEKIVSKKLRIGFIAAGNMANTMAECIEKFCPELIMWAVAARDYNRAVEFADKHNFRYAYHTYEELLDDENVDLVYISSPGSFHYEHVMLSLKKGKHVLCEKPFSLSYGQARTMLDYAEKKGLFISDGLWTMYLPLAQKIKEIADSGIIGKVSSLIANQHYIANKSKRLTQLETGGGALLEMGVYLLSFAVMIMGQKVKKVYAKGILNGNGVDKQDVVVLEYEDGLAILNCGLDAVSDRRGYVYGDKGFIVVEDANEYKKLCIYNAEGALTDEVRMESGYQYELRSCVEAILANSTQARQRPHRDILYLTELLDKARDTIGVDYGLLERSEQ